MFVRKIAFLLIALCLLCGCSTPAQDSSPSTAPTQPTEPSITTQPTELTTQTTEATTQPTDAATQENTESLEILRAALADVTYFDSKYLYMELLSYGFEQHSVQNIAKDGSFHFLNETRQWNHSSDREQTQNVEYYYRYEDGDLHFYSRIDAGELQHGVLTQQNIDEMNATKELIIGSSSIFPAYLEDFTEDVDEQGQLCFRYRLPTQRVLEDQTIASSFLNSAVYCAQLEASKLADTCIHCTVWVDSQTMQPTRLYQDYAELKPYLLSNGALSGEYALSTDLLYLEIALGYDAPDTTDIPDEFLSDTTS